MKRGTICRFSLKGRIVGLIAEVIYWLIIKLDLQTFFRERLRKARKEPRIEVRTRNTYEAAYYLTKGAFLKEVAIRPVAENRRRRLGYSNQWEMWLGNVPHSAKYAWQVGQATCSVKDIEFRRKYIKRWFNKAEKE